MNYKRIILVILDGVGVGHASDAKSFDDIGANTVGSIDNNLGLKLPTLERLGLGLLDKYKTIKHNENNIGTVTRLHSQSAGKDSVAGHWELMGATISEPFNNFTENGFPKELINEFSKRTGRPVICNKEYSGTKVINDYYNEHIEKGAYIVYTSVDSTFQIAAHESIIKIEELYKACEIARELTNDNNHPEWKVSRVIARPFLGVKDDTIRTGNRHDYSLTPFKETTLDILVKNNHKTLGIGKINDLFNGSGISKSIHTSNNDEGMEKTIESVLNDTENSFIFTNLVDFDSVYGHPRDPIGFKTALEKVDGQLQKLIDSLKDDDLLMITADHGNDPYFKGNDHTRENTPFITYNYKTKAKSIVEQINFCDVGQTILDNFNLTGSEGKSFLKLFEEK